MATINVVTGITVERKLFIFPKGTLVSSAVCTDDPTDCCAESGSVSGSGSGSGVFAICCNGYVPATLTLTLSNVSADACFSGTVDLQYYTGSTPSEPIWQNTTPLAVCSFGGIAGALIFTLQCHVDVGSGLTFWRLALTGICTAPGGPWDITVDSCDPYYAELTATLASTPLCFGGDIHMVITE